MMRIPKPLLEEFGGGMQEFTLKDVSAISFILEDLCHFRSSSFDRKSQQLSAFEDSHPVFFPQGLQLRRDRGALRVFDLSAASGRDPLLGQLAQGREGRGSRRTRIQGGRSHL